MRWGRYLLLLVIVGTLQMLLGGQLPLPRFGVEWLFLIALHTSLHASAWTIVPAFWCAGVLRDVLLGGHLGASAILYTLAGIAVLGLRRRVLVDHFMTRIGFVFISLLILLLLRPLLEGQGAALAPRLTVLSFAARDATASSIAGLLVGVVLRNTSLRTWREEERPYSLALR